MNWFRYLQRKARSLFGKPGLEADMDDEMRSHIEMQTQENIESGMSAVVYCGSMVDWPLLTEAERKECV